MERFLRGESSQQENREIIRHLLSECELCQETVREAARRQGFKVTTAPAPALRVAHAG
jgi:PP-loop superfamily ATP-utilizing enzyme